MALFLGNGGKEPGNVLSQRHPIEECLTVKQLTVFVPQFLGTTIR
jgi:hypothetical protein